MEQVRRRRKKGRRIFKNSVEVMKAVCGEYPDTEIGGEQPLRATSWGATAWINLRGNLHSCHLDGCEFDMRDENGELQQNSCAS